jgi:hypothetical protein
VTETSIKDEQPLPVVQIVFQEPSIGRTRPDRAREQLSSLRTDQLIRESTRSHFEQLWKSEQTGEEQLGFHQFGIDYDEGYRSA